MIPCTVYRNETPEPGPSTGWCYGIADIGSHEKLSGQFPKPGQFDRKLILFFECSEQLRKEGEFAGTPFILNQRFNVTMGSKSVLRKFIEAWQNIKFATDDEALEWFNTSLYTLVGQPCAFNIQPSTDPSYMDITSVTKLRKNEQPGAPLVNTPFVFVLDPSMWSLTPEEADTLPEPARSVVLTYGCGRDIYPMLLPWVQKAIAGTEEFKACLAVDTVEQPGFTPAARGIPVPAARAAAPRVAVPAAPAARPAAAAARRPAPAAVQAPAEDPGVDAEVDDVPFDQVAPAPAPAPAPVAARAAAPRPVAARPAASPVAGGIPVVRRQVGRQQAF